jgi:branched-chain amino acid transport system permease protein
MEYWLQLLVNGLVIGMTYALMAVGLTLIFGILGTINFAHGEFYMLGAFFLYTFSMSLGLNYLIAGALAIAGVALLAFIIERFALRPLIGTDHLNTLLATFGISIIIANLANVIYGVAPKELATPFQGVISLGNVYITSQKVLVIVAGIVIIVLLALFIKYSQMGKLMRATAQNEMGAKVSGIPIKRVYSFTFVIGIALASAAGVLVGPTTFITPTMGMQAMLKGFVIVILGGLGSVPGAIAGGILLGIVETLGTSVVGNAWKDVIGFAILILVLLFRPEGMFGLKGRTQ